MAIRFLPVSMGRASRRSFPARGGGAAPGGAGAGAAEPARGRAAAAAGAGGRARGSAGAARGRAPRGGVRAGDWFGGLVGVSGVLSSFFGGG